MFAIVTFFDKSLKTYTLQGKYLEHFNKSFKGHKDRLGKLDKCIAFFAGKENSSLSASELIVNEVDVKESKIVFKFGQSEKLDLTSGFVARHLRKMAMQRGWNDEKGMAPLVCVFPKSEDVLEELKKAGKIEKMMDNKDYKGVCMMFAPLSESKRKPQVWNDADTLYALGLACSKLSVSLLVKATETKKLLAKAKYRKYCVAFLTRGYEIEHTSSRFATALAYRYYSNVHELMRPGERRDSDVEEEIKLANEWLSKAIEMNPSSIKNHYRKGKLIIEKQAPYLLFGKKSYGKGEAKILHEIRQVGEEHLARAITLYEELTDEYIKSINKREYAKALFVLGRHYLGETNLPVHEYYLSKIANVKPDIKIEDINKLNLESALSNLKKSFAVESDMLLGADIDIGKLASIEKEWTNSPIKKLYQIGCVYSDSVFILASKGNSEKAQIFAQKAIKMLQNAKKVADMCKDRKRNTWYISEKIAWTYIYIGKYEMAAKLLKNARAGYVLNTYATALLLCGKENEQAALAAINVANNDKHNLAKGFTSVLYSYLKAKPLDTKDMSDKNKKLADILQVELKKAT